MTDGDRLAAMSDGELLAAIRRGDVSAAADRAPRDAGYWYRDDILRGEAKRRGII